VRGCFVIATIPSLLSLAPAPQRPSKVAAERQREEDEAVALISMPPLPTHSTVDDSTRYLEQSVDMTVREREYIDTMERDVHKVPGLPASRADFQSPPRRC
jgi:hypothetical protein